MDNQIVPLTFPDRHVEGKFSQLKAGHIAIRTHRYNAVIAWYKEKLDFRLIREWEVGELQLAFIAPPNDDTFMIEILGVKKEVKQDSSKASYGYDHICFNVADLEKIINELKSRDLAILRSFSVPAIGKRSAFISDPFGNSIEFCQDLKP